MVKSQNLKKKIGNIYIFLGILFCVSAIILLAYPQLPYILNWLSISSPEIETENITQPIFTEEIEEITYEPVKKEFKKTLPPIKPELPESNNIYIPKIGVSSEIQTGTDYMQALENGPWIVPDFSNSQSRYLEDSLKPTIIASHRFGYSSWSEQKRNSMSFFKLPETKLGDSIVIVWNQREYIYEIVDEDQAEYIKRDDIDLILYTCMYYNSPLRVFRYANLISINGEEVI